MVESAPTSCNINQLFEKLICLQCSSSITGNNIDESILCNNCGQKYPMIHGIPVLIDESQSIFTFQDFADQRSLFFDMTKSGDFISKVSKFIPSASFGGLSRKNFDLVEDELQKLPSKANVLILGGSIEGVGIKHFLNNPAFNIVESDVSFGPRTQIILDAHQIPFTDETFDCVIAQAVLEHVIDPVQCVKEIYRVLKPGGIIYSEIPFMQQVHGGAYDFTRYSMSGHRRLFRNFSELKSGALAGVGTSFAWSYNYLFQALFGFNKPLRLFIKAFTRFTGFWLKYIDVLTASNKRSIDGASVTYFIGAKSHQTISDKEIIKYYK